MRRPPTPARLRIAGVLVAVPCALLGLAAPLLAQRPPVRPTRPAASRAADTSLVRHPVAGIGERAALMDAVRASVRTSSRFKVHDVRVAGRWAFVHATEVVELDDVELQETDLTVMALLQSQGDAPRRRWTVVELWTLPTEERRSHAHFARAVRERQEREGFPVGLLPDEVR